MKSLWTKRIDQKRFWI